MAGKGSQIFLRRALKKFCLSLTGRPLPARTGYALKSATAAVYRMYLFLENSIRKTRKHEGSPYAPNLERRRSALARPASGTRMRVSGPKSQVNEEKNGMDKPREQVSTPPQPMNASAPVHETMQQPAQQEGRTVPSAVPEYVQAVPHGTRTAAPEAVSLDSRRQGGDRRRQTKPEARSDSFRTARGSAILESLEMPFVSHEAAPMTSQDNLIPRTGATELPSKNASLEEDEGERES